MTCPNLAVPSAVSVCFLTCGITVIKVKAFFFLENTLPKLDNDLVNFLGSFPHRKIDFLSYILCTKGKLKSLDLRINNPTWKVKMKGEERFLVFYLTVFLTSV